MTNYREIITKAVIGKGKKELVDIFQIECEQKPDTVLGCWVINNKFNGKNNNGIVNVEGSYDVNVWYSYDNDTKTAVTTQRFNYNDVLNMNLKENSKIDNHSEIIVDCLKQPTVSDVSIENGKIDLKVDKSLGVQIIGNTTVKVAIEEDFDEYEELFDSDEEKELDINTDELNDDFIEDVNK